MGVTLFAAKLEAVGFDFPSKLRLQGNATLGPQGLWASAVSSRLGFKQEVTLLGAALLL